MPSGSELHVDFDESSRLLISLIFSIAASAEGPSRISERVFVASVINFEVSETKLLLEAVPMVDCAGDPTAQQSN